MSVFTKNDFQFGYLYGWLDCYNKEFQTDVEDFIIQINKKCGRTILDLDMLKDLMEIISPDAPEIIDDYVKIGDSEQEFFVRLINNKVETFEPDDDYRICCTNNCNNKAQEKDLDDEYCGYCIKCEEALIKEERDEYNRLEQSGNLIGENPYKNINEGKLCIKCPEKIKDTTTYLTRDGKWSNSWCCEACHRIWYHYGKQIPY